MQPSQLAALPQKLQGYFYNAQNRIIADVARRIKKAGEITSTADYQLNKYLILGGTTEQIQAEIKRLTSKTDAEIADIYDQVIDSDYVRYKEIYEQINGNFPSIVDPENEILNTWITGIMEQTRGQIQNISESLGFMVPAGNGLTFTPLTNIYQKYVDAACMDVVTGSFDYNTVLKRTVKELSRSGIRAVDYASGQVNRAPVAVRRAVLTGVNQVSAKINEKVAQDLGTEYFEVTAHAGARPSHAEWQGKVYKHSELVSVCGLGDVAGLCGANCRHAYYAFFPGISVRAYSDEDLQRIREQDAKEETWLGKTYNGYERTQKARQYESTMRQQRSYIQALNEGGADPADIQAAQTRYLNTMNEYKGFCAQMDMRPDMQRVYIDGLGRMSGGRIVSENSLKNRSENNNYSVAWQKVRSKEYNTRINKVINNQDVSDKIATSARRALINRDGKETEELYALSINTGKDISSITNQNYKFGVRRTPKFQSDIERAKDRGDKIVYIHNHPGGSPPSITDLNQLVGTNDVGIIAGHNGNLYYYTAPKTKLNDNDLKVAYMKHKDYTGEVKAEKAMIELSRDEKFNFEFVKI